MDAEWPGKEDFPYIALIRILPQNVLQVAVATTIERVAQTMNHKASAGDIQKAVKAAIIQINAGQARVSTEGGDEYPQCGNDLALLLSWLSHHHGPDPGPWYDIATVGLIGQVLIKVGGPLRETVTPVLQAAAIACAKQ
jgi:hypothetical protein